MPCTSLEHALLPGIGQNLHLQGQSRALRLEVASAPCFPDTRVCCVISVSDMGHDPFSGRSATFSPSGYSLLLLAGVLSVTVAAAKASDDAAAM
eukprot:25292-Rhodomonas_salina.3